MPSAYLRLRDFLRRTMRMSHVYQPVMLEAMLTHGGSASTREVATAILAHDESQIEYYEQRVNVMPDRVLRRHRMVERQGSTYVLVNAADLSSDERNDLVALCRRKVEEFKARRGETIWQHRALAAP